MREGRGRNPGKAQGGDGDSNNGGEGGRRGGGGGGGGEAISKCPTDGHLHLPMRQTKAKVEVWLGHRVPKSMRMWLGVGAGRTFLTSDQHCPA